MMRSHKTKSLTNVKCDKATKTKTGLQKHMKIHERISQVDGNVTITEDDAESIVTECVSNNEVNKRVDPVKTLIVPQLGEETITMNCENSDHVFQKNESFSVHMRVQQETPPQFDRNESLINRASLERSENFRGSDSLSKLMGLTQMLESYSNF